MWSDKWLSFWTFEPLPWSGCLINFHSHDCFHATKMIAIWTKHLNTILLILSRFLELNSFSTNFLIGGPLYQYPVFASWKYTYSPLDLLQWWPLTFVILVAWPELHNLEGSLKMVVETSWLPSHLLMFRWRQICSTCTQTMLRTPPPWSWGASMSSCFRRKLMILRRRIKTCMMRPLR